MRVRAVSQIKGMRSLMHSEGHYKKGTTTITNVIHANVTRNLLSSQLMQKLIKLFLKETIVECMTVELVLTGTLGDDNLIKVDNFDRYPKTPR